MHQTKLYFLHPIDTKKESSVWPETGANSWNRTPCNPNEGMHQTDPSWGSEDPHTIELSSWPSNR